MRRSWQLTWLMSAAITLAIPAAFAQSDALCVMEDVFIVNLSQDEKDKNDGLACTALATDAQIRSCIAAEIAAAVPEACQSRFDIFVPGTNAEHGAWKQFNYLFRTNTNRAKLSLRYEDVREIEGLLGKLDPGKYDVGVEDAHDSLILLLDALRQNFQLSEVRVYGHSKGSHSVALVAPKFPAFDFYAFAQPGRTDRDINLLDSNIGRGLRGRPGYIEKLSGNLVGITFSNDEVTVFRGLDGPAPASVPERWDQPGFVWQTTLGGNPAGSYRIDHHNNYGGDYTDGGNGPDDWRDGKGSVKDNLPYCITGSQAAWSESECDKQRVRQVPWFWGTPECEAEAYRMMQLGDVGDRYPIGYSGPREPGSCRQANLLIRADYRLRIRWNLPDRHCRYVVRLAFQDIGTGKETGNIVYEGTTDNDETWFVRTGTVVVPIHMQLKLRGELIERGSGSCASAFESEAYINYFELTYTHPGTGASMTRTLIGLDEGVGNLTRLNGDNNIGWEQPSEGSEDLYLYYSTLGAGSLKIEGGTSDGHKGNFRKRVHLIE